MKTSQAEIDKILEEVEENRRKKTDAVAKELEKKVKITTK